MVVNNEIFKIYNEVMREKKRLEIENITSEEQKEKLSTFTRNIQTNYVKKHRDYFKSSVYEQELIELKKYLDGLKNGTRDKNSKYDLLYKVIAIYNSNKPDAMKLLYLKQIVNINDFSKLIGPFLVTCMNNSIIRKAYEVYQFFDNYKKDVTILMVDNNEFKDDVKEFYSLIDSGVCKKEILDARSRFIQKYQYYFDSSEYKKKVEWLKLYLDPHGPRMVNNLNKVPKLIDIYNSNVCDHEKINQISKLISPIKLIKLLIPYAVTFYDNDFIKDAMKVYFFVKEHENEFDLVKKNVLYLEDLSKERDSLLSIKDYAYKVLNYYINDSCYLSISDYIKQLDISITLFDDCVSACAIFNHELYQKFLEVRNHKENVVINDKINIIYDLIKGIKTGYLSDGTELTCLEFMKRIPFKNEINYIPDDFINYYGFHLRLFINEEDVNIITNYMKDNRVNSFTMMEIDTESEFSYHSIDDVIVTKEIHDYIIKYMQYYSYPLIRGIYHILLMKYLNNELEIVDEIKNSHIKVKTILVP